MEQLPRAWSRVDFAILGAVSILIIIALLTNSLIKDSIALDQTRIGTAPYKSTYICGKTGNIKCKLGQLGPGGGTIFFVDYYNEYANFNFLETAPSDWHKANDTVDPTTQWCSNLDSKILSSNTWTSRQVGLGKFNTVEMLKVCKSGAATEVQNYNLSKDAKVNDWFLPSLGELMLISANLQGLGNLLDSDYWSSSEYSEVGGWVQAIGHGYQGSASKNTQFHVRPIRQF